MAAQLPHKDYQLVPKEQADAFAWSFEGPNQEPKLYPFKFPPIQPNEVRIQQTYLGLCYTDCHIVNQDWFPINYPCVPGHEILGKVVLKGDAVTQFQIGDLVGAGFIRDSCGTCKLCVTGSDQLCGNVTNHLMPLPSFGGFATHVQMPAYWAFPIPSSIPQELAPPLMCAGITVFAPLKRYFGAHKEVGIIGIGGLGHLAIKFSSKLGMRTTAISHTANKEAEAKSYGAVDFINSSDSKQMNQNSKRFDLIINCANTSSVEQFTSQINLVKNGGEYVLVGVPDVNKCQLSLPFFSLIGSQISLIGSLVGSREENYQMLEFAAKHKIYPTCEHYDFPNFNDAYNKLWKGQPRYRCVVKVGDSTEQLKH